MILEMLRYPGGQKALTSADLGTMLAASNTAAGVAVTPQKSLTYSAVFACVRVTAESLGQLPIHVMRRRGSIRERAVDHPLHRIFHTEGPNEFQTAQEFMEWVGACLALRGNAYAFITESKGEVLELLPIAPGTVEPKLLDDWTVVYEVTMKGGKKVFPASKIFHVKLFTTDGFTGLSPIGYARETVGFGLAQQEHGSRLFSNSARPGGILSTEKQLSKDAAKRLRDDVEELVAGASNAHRLLVLGEGMKWTQMGLSAEDAQWLESRKFTRSEVAGIFRVPLHKIADLERATFSNIEHQGLEFVTDSLMPYVTRFEGRARKQLISEKDRKEVYVKLNVAGLLRGDMKARAEFYTRQIQNGAMSPNEVREFEDMNPREGGDVFLTPANMLIDGKPPEGDKQTPP